MAGNNENNTRLNLAHTLGSIYRDIFKNNAKTQVVTIDVEGEGTESILGQNNPLPVIVTQGGNQQTVNSDGYANIVSHGHPDAGYLHLDYAVTGGTDVDMILIDLSDTTNYPHSNTNFIHLEEVFIDVDAEVNAAYSVIVGFLENVDDTNGDLYEIFHLSGDKATGQNQSLSRKLSPNGPKCNSAYVVTSDISLNDTKYQTDVNLISTLDTTTADTPSGNGDLVLFIDAGAGGANTNFDVEINISYHTH